MTCISPKDCYTTGRGLEMAVVGERTTCNVVLHMIHHTVNSYTEEVETITCEVIYKLTGQKCDCGVNKTRWNEYEISYQATSRGRHQLHIKVEGEHIKGSPFNVTVKLSVQEFGTPIKIISGVKEPWGVAVNQKGALIVAERCEHCISIFSPTGEKLRSFGSKGSGPGQFDEPRDVTVDSDDKILVADCNHRVQKFSSEYKFITSVGSHGSNHLQFDHPQGVAISPTTNKIAVSDWDNHRVQILNPDMTFHSSIGSEGSGSGQFDNPHDIAFDGAGNMYVSDASNHRIQVFTPEGKFLRQFGKRGKGDGELNRPTGISIDSDDTVYVVENINHRISIFTHKGQFLTSFGSKGDGPGQFKNPYRITVDKNGAIYVSDSGNNRIQIF